MLAAARSISSGRQVGQQAPPFPIPAAIYIGDPFIGCDWRAVKGAGVLASARNGRKVFGMENVMRLFDHHVVGQRTGTDQLKQKRPGNRSPLGRDQHLIRCNALRNLFGIVGDHCGAEALFGGFEFGANIAHAEVSSSQRCCISAGDTASIGWLSVQR